MSPLAVSTLALGVLSAVLMLAGGIVFFVVGRSRGALVGIGFVVLAVGTVLGSLFSTFAPTIIRDLDISVRDFVTGFSIAQLLFDLLGWGMIIAAVIALAGSGRTPVPRPGTPHLQAPPGYGPYPAPFESGYPEPPFRPQGPPRPPGY